VNRRTVELRRRLAVLYAPRSVFVARWRLDHLDLALRERVRLATVSEFWWWFGAVCAAASRLASRFRFTPWRRI
jgi:hypothetical protein